MTARTTRDDIAEPTLQKQLGTCTLGHPCQPSTTTRQIENDQNNPHPCRSEKCRERHFITLTPIGPMVRTQLEICFSVGRLASVAGRRTSGESSSTIFPRGRDSRSGEAEQTAHAGQGQVLMSSRNGGIDIWLIAKANLVIGWDSPTPRRRYASSPHSCLCLRSSLPLFPLEMKTISWDFPGMKPICGGFVKWKHWVLGNDGYMLM